MNYLPYDACDNASVSRAFFPQVMFDRAIRMGDIVEVDGHRGRDAAIGMRSSSIKRFDGVEMLVPNSIFLQQNIINWTSSDMTARYSVAVGVAYSSSTQDAEQVTLKAVEAQPEVLQNPPPYVIFESFADSALNFTAYFWIELVPEVNSLVVFSDIATGSANGSPRRESASLSRSVTCILLLTSRWTYG